MFKGLFSISVDSLAVGAFPLDCEGTRSVPWPFRMTHVQPAAAFFGMGLALLVLFALFYQFTTSFDIHSEIESNNTAVGIALGGNLIGIGIVTFKAVFGDFDGWSPGIASFLTFGVIGFALLYVMRLLIDKLLLPTVRTSHAMTIERNLGVAYIESAVVISSALILFFAI